MSSYASTSIPKPKNWQDFEGHSRVLFRCVLNDPNVLTHGRGGQAQHGVDIYGERESKEDHWVGVQCKLRGSNEQLTKAEIDKEIDKAKKFRPSLKEFIIITTAPDDAVVQRTAREITRKHNKHGLFSVSVWGWQALEQEITRYPEAVEAFHPDLTPFSRRQIALGEEAVTLNRETKDDIASMRALLEKHLLF